MVLLHQIIDVLLTVKSSVHDQIRLNHLQEVNVLQKIGNRSDISRISRKLPVIHGKHGYFPIEQGEIDLLQIVSLFVFPVFGQPDGLRV